MRSRQDIVADILELLKEPTVKTRVMYGANLSYSQLQYYIELLEAGGLIQNIGYNKWVSTERGRRLLELYKEAEVMLEQRFPEVATEIQNSVAV